MSSQSIKSSCRVDMGSRRPSSVWAVSVLIGAALSAGGCSSPPSKPDLKRLYQSANVVIEQPPLILIPGIMGSRLRDKTTQQEVWPGGLWRLAFHHYEELALEIDPATLEGRPNNIEAFALTDKTGGEHFYDTITQTLTDSGSFELTKPGTPVKDAFTRHLYLFPYDWRLDNVETARKLSALIDQLRLDYGRPDLKVDIVAHSMGGIVSRYLIEFGTDDVLDRDDPPITMAGASKINRLILLGTPSLGSTDTIQNMVVGAKLVVERIKPQTLATLPSAFQLLPNSDRKPLVGIDGRPLRTDESDGASPERDIFDVNTWRELQWSVFNPELASQLGAARTEVLQRYFAKQLFRAGASAAKSRTGAARIVGQAHRLRCGLHIDAGACSGGVGARAHGPVFRAAKNQESVAQSFLRRTDERARRRGGHESVDFGAAVPRSHGSEPRRISYRILFFSVRRAFRHPGQHQFPGQSFECNFIPLTVNENRLQ